MDCLPASSHPRACQQHPSETPRTPVRSTGIGSWSIENDTSPSAASTAEQDEEELPSSVREEDPACESGLRPIETFFRSTTTQTIGSSYSQMTHLILFITTTSTSPSDHSRTPIPSIPPPLDSLKQCPPPLSNVNILQRIHFLERRIQRGG